MSPTQNNAFRGTETARHLGPTPRGWLKFGRMLACRTRTTRNRRVKVCNWAVERRFRAIYLQMGDSDFVAVKARFLEIATYNRSQTGKFSEFPDQIYSQATGVKSLS